MSFFKEQLERDVNQVFFNLDEFAELHTIDGVELSVVLDSIGMEQNRAKAGYAGNIGTARLLLFVKAVDLNGKPAVDAQMRVDGKQYRVLSVSGESVYEITLGAMR